LVPQKTTKGNKRMQVIEVTRDQAEKDIKLGEEMEKLLLNRSFKKVFLEGYFRDEAARLAKAITNYEMQDEVNQREIDGQFRAIGHVQNFILEIKKKANVMKDALAEEEREEIESNKIFEVDPITGDEYEVGGE
jgi:hypothetical protein